MWTARALLLTLFLLCLATAQKSRTYTRTYVTQYLETFPGPQVYKDVHSGTTLYVETDGRHVSAISRNGKLLWTKKIRTRMRMYRLTGQKNRKSSTSAQSRNRSPTPGLSPDGNQTSSSQLHLTILNLDC